MVRVFVSDQDAGDAFGRAANGSEALPGLAGAEPGVNVNAGFAGLQVGAITAGTAAQNSQLNGHKGTVIGDGCRSNGHYSINAEWIGKSQISNLEFQIIFRCRAIRLRKSIRCWAGLRGGAVFAVRQFGRYE